MDIWYLSFRFFLDHSTVLHLSVVESKILGTPGTKGALRGHWSLQETHSRQVICTVGPLVVRKTSAVWGSMWVSFQAQASAKRCRPLLSTLIREYKGHPLKHSTDIPLDCYRVGAHNCMILNLSIYIYIYMGS